MEKEKNLNQERTEAKTVTPTRNQLGTFGGVFTPSILTILGVIMFMRVGFVVGQAGIFYTILILLISKSITTLTSFSISAVSTNTPVAGGGAYFLISRALGPEYGGAIGLALYGAQTTSIPFYILGFTEALVRSFPNLMDHFLTISLVTTAVLFFISYTGANWAIKTQYLIMSVLGLSILSFMAGSASRFETNIFIDNWGSSFIGSEMSFWSTFAIYFPAVTGIMTGVNMSGDLKNPSRSIPLGTFAAVGIGFLIYLCQILIIGGAQTRGQLINASFETLCDQAIFGTGFLVIAGVFSATLSSALGSFLGAPRVLQAVASDKVIPPLDFFARGSIRGNEPHRALCLTFGVSLMVIIWAGKDTSGNAFNTLAAIVTMFFLYTYGMVNMAAFVESFAGNPSFRPSFRYYHWTPAIIGAVACGITAFLIDPLPALIAGVFIVFMYILLRRQALIVHFGDARWGFTYSQLRNNLLKLSMVQSHPKNWRPTLLVLTGNPETRLTMVRYALCIGEARGMVTLARVLAGDLNQIRKRRETAMAQLRVFLAENSMKAFPCVVATQNLDEGLTALIQGHPIGPVSPNIVMMGWSSDPERSTSFVHHLNTGRLLGMSLIVVKDKGYPKEKGERRIDIWWRGYENGSLMVLLAHLITLNWDWTNSNIRLLRLINDEAGRVPSTAALQELVEKSRVNASVQVIVSKVPVPEIIQLHSSDATVVFLGFNVPEETDARSFQIRFENIMEKLPTTLLVCSSGEADLLV